MSVRPSLIASCLATALAIPCGAQQMPVAPPAPTGPARIVAGIPVNYEEALVGSYTLPDPLRLANGQRVTDAATWNARRRPEILRLFEVNQFGRAPGRPAALRTQVFEAGTPAFDGRAIRRQVTVFLTADSTGPKMDLLVYVPSAARGPVPLLLNVSFGHNSSVVADSAVRGGEVWSRGKTRVPATRAMPGRGLNVLPFIESGIGVATVYYGDIEPDFLGGIPFGIRGRYLAPGKSEPAPDEWGAIAAWAWGLSRAMDYFETDTLIDARRVALLGASRLGKTVLWTGANDQRFAMVLASVSGEGGAALSRRNYGETIKHLTEPTRYPYQFAGNYGRFGDRVSEFPVDGHMLVSLIAPRPLLLQTGDTDFWSDPKGEFLAAVAAGPVYRLLGKQDLGTDRMPAAGESILNTLGYYMHAGGHGTLPGDWPVFLEFMKKHLLPAR
jgi:hypothetical protein